MATPFEILGVASMRYEPVNMGGTQWLFLFDARGNKVGYVKQDPTSMNSNQRVIYDMRHNQMGALRPGVVTEDAKAQIMFDGGGTRVGKIVDHPFDRRNARIILDANLAPLGSMVERHTINSRETLLCDLSGKPLGQTEKYPGLAAAIREIVPPRPYRQSPDSYTSYSRYYPPVEAQPEPRHRAACSGVC